MMMVEIFNTLEIEKVEKIGNRKPSPTEMRNFKTEHIEREFKPSVDWGDEIGEKFEEQVRKNKILTQEILEGYDKATNSDIILLFEFWNLMEQVKITESQDRKEVIVHINKSKVPFMTAPETISRMRRHLNSKGIGLPTDNAVFIRRMRRQQTIRKYFKENSEQKFQEKGKIIK